MNVDYRIISIGTLAAHPLWDEKGQVRTGHATTTLIRAGDATIIVDPSLPSAALLARLGERWPRAAADINHVFLTSFNPELRRGLGAFADATWWLHEPERDSAVESLNAQLEEAEDADDDELVELITRQQDILNRCEVAPDKPALGVDLFPLPGVTPGLCGLLLTKPHQTVLICGDAIPTVEHLERGQVLQTSVSIEQAQESFQEAVEIADVIVPGRDNIILNPLRQRG
jgi:glyoxylase-like metal-dependent hydrolase (beta-lactamase superfamily II)